MKLYYFLMWNNHLRTNSGQCLGGKLTHWNTLEIRVNDTHIKINLGLWSK